MKTMNVIKNSVMVLLFIVTSVPVYAQDKKSGNVRFNIAGDLVSSYIWRGMYQSGASIQPTLGLQVGRFSLTAWGSADFTGQGHKEADLTAAYSVGGFTLSLADYWWAGQALNSEKGNGRRDGQNEYFNFDNHTTDHILEAGLSYVLPLEKLPLGISWYTMIWGHDKKMDGTNDNAYSSYAELAYPFAVKGMDLTATVGCSPFSSPMNYLNDGFAVTNISLKAVKEIMISNRFSLPVFTQLIWNPNREDVHFVFGITLR